MLLLFYTIFLTRAHRDGRLKVNDQIVRINGRSLDGLQHSEAIKLLQSQQGTVELVVLRDSHASGHASIPHSPQSPLASHGTEHAPASASSTSSALTTPLTGASTSSEVSQKTFTLPQAPPSSSGGARRPHPPRMSQYLEEESEEMSSVSTTKGQSASFAALQYST